MQLIVSKIFLGMYSLPMFHKKDARLNKDEIYTGQHV